MGMGDTMGPSEEELGLKLNPEQVELLKNSGFEVLEEHPQVVYLKGEESDFDTLECQQWKKRKAGESTPDAITKPVVIVESSSKDQRRPSLNESLEALANNTRISPALADFSQKGKLSREAFSERNIPYGMKEGKNLYLAIGHYNNWFSKSAELNEGQVATINHEPESLTQKKIILVNLHMLYRTFIEKRDDVSVNQDSLEILADAETLKTAIPEGAVPPMFGRPVDYEALSLKLIDFNENFFPGKVQELAQLEKERSAWMRSLKVPE